MTLKIGVEADFDPSSAEAQIKQFGKAINDMMQQAAQANKTQFNPIDVKSLDDIKRIKQEFEVLLRLNANLRRAIKQTGQEGKDLTQIDFNRLLPNAGTRGKQMQNILNYVLGANHAPLPAGGGGGNQPPVPPTPTPPSSPAGGGAGRLAQSVLNSVSPLTGGVGGVAAGALGTGMSSGFGAGVAGLFGGMLALGVGKLVGNIADRMQQAEDNAVAYDRLKRVLGDVGVSFGALKTTVNETAGKVKLTFSETAKLATDYAKSANLSTGQAGQLPKELMTSVGFARAFGGDPTFTSGIFGQLRGSNVTRSEQDTRRFALLIGETIGKSNAFSQMENVSQALADYATSQARGTLGNVNTAGYAGMFSAMVGSKIPGLDATGSAALLARLQTTMSAGGAHGEASQFFTGRVGASMGLSPLQTMVMRELGPFATANMAFGKGSAYASYMPSGVGQAPTGNLNYLQATRNLLDKDMPDRNENDRLLKAIAFANHTGLGINQSMRLMKMKPNELGELQDYADLGKMSESGIGNLYKAKFGSANDLKALAADMFTRTGSAKLSEKENAALTEAMTGKDINKQRETLAGIVALRDQAETDGSNIRDSKNLLDNLKTEIASKLIPYTQDMRAGILRMAGVGQNGVTLSSIQKSIATADSESRIEDINRRIDPQLKKLRFDKERLEHAISSDSKLYQYDETPAGNKARADRENRLKIMTAERDKITATITNLEKDKADSLKAESIRKAEIIKQIDVAAAEKQKLDDKAITQEKDRQKLIEEEVKRQKKMDALIKDGKWGSTGAATYSTLVDAVANQESGNRHRNPDGSIITSPKGAKGVMQIMPNTGRNPGYGVRPAQDDSEEENRREGRDYLAALIKHYGGDERKGLAAYNGGPGRLNKAIRRAQTQGGDWMDYMPSETRKYVPSVMEKMGHPLPQGGVDKRVSSMGWHLTVDDIEVVHRNDRYHEIGRQSLSTRVSQAPAFGVS